MTNRFFTRFIKSLLVTTPFLILILMVLALWGIGGKTIYPNMNSSAQQSEFGVGKAKNYFVKETQNHGESSNELGKPSACEQKDKNNPSIDESAPEKIIWERVV